MKRMLIITAVGLVCTVVGVATFNPLLAAVGVHVALTALVFAMVPFFKVTYAKIKNRKLKRIGAPSCYTR